VLKELPAEVQEAWDQVCASKADGTKQQKNRAIIGAAIPKGVQWKDRTFKEGLTFQRWQLGYHQRTPRPK
jgi:hypothetical protein